MKENVASKFPGKNMKPVPDVKAITKSILIVTVNANCKYCSECEANTKRMCRDRTLKIFLLFFT